MMFAELCALLTREHGRADVFFARYPSLGTGLTGARASWIIDEHDGRFDVGSEDEDRGTWLVDGTFATESDACDHVYRMLATSREEPTSQTAEERERSLAANEHLIGLLRRSVQDSASGSAG